MVHRHRVSKDYCNCFKSGKSTSKKKDPVVEASSQEEDKIWLTRKPGSSRNGRDSNPSYLGLKVLMVNPF